MEFIPLNIILVIQRRHFSAKGGDTLKIYLRPVTLEDGSTIVKWRNSKNIINHCFSKKRITLESNKKFYNDFIFTGKYKQFIVERIDEDFGVSSYPIATVYLKDIDEDNKRCELCIFTSDDEEWGTESQSIAIQMLLEKAFTEYGLHKVYTYVFSENENEVSLMLKSGFRKEALLKSEAISIDGVFVDVFRMSILREEYIK